MNRLLLSIIIIFCFGTLAAQQQGGMKGQMSQGTAILTGKVLDANSGNAMEYANVVLYNKSSDKIVTGGVTDNKGEFFLRDVPYGMYSMKVKFIGYSIKEMDKIQVSPKSEIVDLGSVMLEPDAKNLNEISVQADQTPVLYHLDRKIVKVSSNLSATGGSAVDALENTPSVNVDIEGNVSLRGSTSFQVLIDGKPSAFTGTDALEMIPVSTIEQIEVITNPSAKYDPEGTAGIINVITKKNALEGISAKLDLSGDTNGSLGADLTVNYKKKRINYFLSANYNDRSRKGYRELDNYTIVDDTTYYTYSEGDRNGGRNSSGIKLGFDYYLGSKSTISAWLDYGKMGFERNAFSDYEEWTDPETTVFNSLSDNISKRSNERYSYNVDFVHKFNQFGHELKVAADYRTGAGGEENESNQYDIDDPNTIISGKTSTEDGNDSDFRLKVDYTNPFMEKGKIEAGYQLTSEHEEEKYTVDYYGSFAGEELGDQLNSAYVRNINAAYGIFAYDFSKLGLQLGLRGEYTDRLLTNQNDGSEYAIDRIDFFPSGHLSYQLPYDMQLLASYSRRIDRPRNYFLEPFITWRDAYTVWQGNPALEPEYINSYEVSFQKRYGKSFVSTELFHRHTTNKHERVRTVYEDYTNVMLHTIANVGQDYSTGAEVMLNLALKSWWNLNVSSSAYHYLIDSELFDTNNEDVTWYIRGRTSFILPKNLRLQFDGNYSAPSVTAQGTSEGFFMFGTALRADFLDRKLSVNFQVRDILGTGKHEFISYGDDFYSRMLFKRDAPVFRLSLSYKFNNFKEKKHGNGDGMDGMDMDF